MDLPQTPLILDRSHVVALEFKRIVVDQIPPIWRTFENIDLGAKLAGGGLGQRDIDTVLLELDWNRVAVSYFRSTRDSAFALANNENRIVV